MEQSYEVMVVVKPLLAEDIKEKVMKKLNNLVKKHNGTLEVKDSIGKRLLAYPINKYKEGYYILYKMTVNPSYIKEIDHDLKLSDEVLRYIIIREDEL